MPKAKRMFSQHYVIEIDSKKNKDKYFVRTHYTLLPHETKKTAEARIKKHIAKDSYKLSKVKWKKTSKKKTSTKIFKYNPDSGKYEPSR